MAQGTAAGDTRWPGTVILTIPDISNMKARVHVLEADAGNLKVGHDGILAPRFAPSTRGWVASGTIVTGFPRLAECRLPVRLRDSGRTHGGC